jgi:hypothetical protein
MGADEPFDNTSDWAKLFQLTKSISPETKRSERKFFFDMTNCF